MASEHAWRQRGHAGTVGRFEPKRATFASYTGTAPVEAFSDDVVAIGSTGQATAS